MRFEMRIALRYLRARRKQTSLSFISFMAIGGVALGVTALIVVQAVMSGVEADLRTRILGTSAHIVVDEPSGRGLEKPEELAQRIEAVPEVLGASPYVLVKAMVRSGSYTDGVVLRGIDPKQAQGVLAVSEQMVQGSLDTVEEPVAGDLPEDKAVPGIVLGETLASSLRTFVGERIQLLIPGAVSTPLGRRPRVRTFQVVGMFRSRVYEYDASWAYTSLDGARELLRMGERVSGFEVKVKDLFEAERAARTIAERLGPEVRVRDWRQMNAAFFSALQLEKWAMFIILCLIVMVAAFNIVSTLTMKVMERTADIGVLKSIGATDGAVLRVFLYEGLTIGLSGTAIGLFVGTSLCYLADTFELIPVKMADLYNMAHLPFRVELRDLLWVCAASLLISLATTLYPSWQASKLRPVEALRNE